MPRRRYLYRETGGEFARAPGVSYLRNGARHQRWSRSRTQLYLRHRQD